MAIRCLNPNTVGTQAEAMFNVTATTGKDLIDSFSSTIENLKIHWKGSDAVANLNDLAKVYTAVTDLIKQLQTIIVSVNNDEVVPLQRHIVASGGSCTIGNELSATLTNVSSLIDVPTEATESYTDPLIIGDAEAFSDFPTKFSNFVDELNAAKEKLLSNWTEGANITDVVSVFQAFNNDVANYKSQLIKVRDNLDIVAQNKAQLL